MRNLLQKSIEKQEKQIIVPENFCEILFSIYLLYGKNYIKELKLIFIMAITVGNLL